MHLLNLAQFDSLGLSSTNLFGSYQFLSLNASKVTKVEVAANNENTIGLALGVNDQKQYLSPWSAPYMSLALKSDEISEKDISNFGMGLRQLLLSYTGQLVTPPLAYGQKEICFLKSFARAKDSLSEQLSFILPLNQASDIEKYWARDTRRNLRLSHRQQFQLHSGDPTVCYKLIANHHAERGYKMAMSEEEVIQTAALIPTDFWTLKCEGKAQAAAYCYHINEHVVQIINCGDTAEGRQKHAMTRLLRELIEYYRYILIDVNHQVSALLDYGPAEINGHISESLVRFKKAHAFIPSPKLILRF